VSCRTGTEQNEKCDTQVAGLAKRYDFSCHRRPAVLYWGSMIFSKNRYPFFEIML